MSNIMNFFKREAVPQAQATPTNADNGAGGGSTYASRIRQANTHDTAMTVAAYYRAVDIISSSIAQMPVEYLVRKNIKGAYQQSLNPTARTLWALWNVRPNKRLNAYQFKKQIVIQTMNRGNAYVIPKRNEDGTVRELVLVAPNAMVNDNPMSETVGIVDYTNGINGTYLYDELYIFRNSFLASNGVGVSTIHYAETTLSISRTTDAESLDRVAKGGRMKGLIKNAQSDSRGINGQYTRGQLSNLRDNLQKQCDEGYDILMLQGDADFIANTMTSADMQFLDSEHFNIQQVARFTGCPLAMLMESTNSNYKTISDSTQDFYARTLAPRVTDMECEITGKDISTDKLLLQKVRINPSTLFRYDLTAQAAWNKSRLECGIVCPNELRIEQDLSPIDGGDDHYVSTNLAVVGSDKLSGGSKNSEPAPEPTPEGDEGE